MALKFLILAFAISAAAATLSPAMMLELEYRLDACAEGFPGRWEGSFDISPQEVCVKNAKVGINYDWWDDSVVSRELPKCMRSAGSTESDVTKLFKCLLRTTSRPYTFIEGKVRYSQLNEYVHRFASEDCLESSKDVNKVDPILNRTCASLMQQQYNFRAGEDAVRKWMEACLDRAGVTKQKTADALECYSNELNDPAVIKRAQDCIKKRRQDYM